MVESLRVAFPGLGDCLLSEDMAGSTMVESLRVALPGLGDCLLSEDVAGEREGVGVAPPRTHPGQRTSGEPPGDAPSKSSVLGHTNRSCLRLGQGRMVSLCAWPNGTLFLNPGLRFVYAWPHETQFAAP